MSYTYEYPRPAVSADCVLFGFDGTDLNVLLIERGREPYKGRWAFPGGFLEMDETTLECANRELEEETGINGLFLKQIGTYSGVDRDPRGRVITVAYYSLVNMSDVNPVANDDAANAGWFTLNSVPAMAFDHDLVLRTALGKLKAELGDQNGSLPIAVNPYSGDELEKLRETVSLLNFDYYPPE